MDQSARQYIAIDLKSFYASVECVERGLDPLDTNLVVADASRTSKTICLAVSPSLKRLGLGGRPRLFEVEQKVRETNRKRTGSGCSGRSYSAARLDADPSLAVDYIVAPPRMAHYIDYSSRIYSIYLRHVSPDDMHVYSIDEVFIDATDYLRLYNLTAHDFAMRMIREVLAATGVTATAGIGTNMYLCKIAMDIVAKKMAPDADGVRIAELNEFSYRSMLWDHKPITDFWRIGSGIARRLAPYGIDTMGQIARISLTNEKLFYDMFGVNAELLIDHAWGWEPVEIRHIKAYRPESRSISSGQVLTCPYDTGKARIVVREMADAMGLKLVAMKMVTSQIVLHIGYDATSPYQNQYDDIPVKRDRFGRTVPVSSHGSTTFAYPTSSSEEISTAAATLYDRIVRKDMLVRRITITAADITDESLKSNDGDKAIQLELFSPTDIEAGIMHQKRERLLQEAMLKIKKAYGKNSILKGLNFAEGATQRLRNRQIGGHHE